VPASPTGPQQNRAGGSSSHGIWCFPMHTTLRLSLGLRYTSRIVRESGAQSSEVEQGPERGEYVKAPPAGSAGTQTANSPSSSSVASSSCAIHPKSSSSAARGKASPSHLDVRHSSGLLRASSWRAWLTGRQAAASEASAGDKPQSHVGAGITLEHTQRWPGCVLPGASSLSTSRVHVSRPDSASANPSHWTRSSSVRARKPPPAEPTTPA
jgi:hypothetical protein